MGIDLFMLGVIAKDLERSREFYRRLGLDIPEENGEQPSITIQMKQAPIFFLTPTGIPRETLTADGDSGEGLRVFFEFYLKTEAAVRAKYAELTGYGYESYRAPFHVTVGVPSPARMCFALINDPDGNAILLSGDAE